MTVPARCPDSGGMKPWTVVDVPGERAALAGVVAVRTACVVETFGNDDMADPVEVELARDHRYTRAGYLAAVEADRTLGAAFVDYPLTDNTSMAWMRVQVLPDERGRGIGSALYAAALDRVRSSGRTLVISPTYQGAEPPAGPATLDPPTGSGRVALADAGVRFARARGWSLEQVNRRSELALPVAGLDHFYDEAAAAAGPDYRVHTWETDTPERWLDQYAYVLSRMSTDAPKGGLELEAEAWDGARVRAQEKKTHAGGYRTLVLAAEHVPTGTLAAFTNFWVPPHTEEFVHQGDTLVVPDHRGRRLGMLVKAANLRRLADERPSVRRVGTWNAEENRWMLAINVALGFRPAGGSGEWQLKLS